MATIENISSYQLTVSYLEEGRIVQHCLSPKGGEKCRTPELTDEQVRKWASGPGLGFLRPANGRGQALAVVRLDGKKTPGSNKTSNSELVKVFVGGSTHEVHPDVAAALYSLTSGAVVQEDVFGEAKESEPGETVQEEDEEEAESAESEEQAKNTLAALPWNAAVKRIKECDDRDLLQEWLETETRPAVIEALNHQLDVA